MKVTLFTNVQIIRCLVLQAPKPYDFSYGVSDPYKGIDFGQTEKSDGNQVKGSYSVQLPDGRKQTVSYKP